MGKHLCSILCFFSVMIFLIYYIVSFFECVYRLFLSMAKLFEHLNVDDYQHFYDKEINKEAKDYICYCNKDYIYYIKILSICCRFSVFLKGQSKHNYSF